MKEKFSILINVVEWILFLIILKNKLLLVFIELILFNLNFIWKKFKYEIFFYVKFLN